MIKQVNENRISLSRTAVIEFYDTVYHEGRGHVNAITAVVGEEMGLSLISHYLHHQLQADVEILNTPCKGEGRTGNWLDGWLKVHYPEREVLLYQVEVKNWSAHSAGGKTLRLDADEETAKKFRAARWSSYWDKDLCDINNKDLRKVLTPMKPPYQLPVEPVACMWAPMHIRGDKEPWFTVKLGEHCHFRALNVFSMSNYLRGLAEDSITLEMPDTIRRLNCIAKLFSLKISM